MSRRAKFRLEVQAIFSGAEERIADAIEVMLADLTCRGLLGSSETIERAITIYETESARALQMILAKLSNMLRPRSARRNAATKEVASALEEHFKGAGRALAGPIRLTKDQTPSAVGAIQHELDQVADRLKEQLADFVQETAAPEAKNRHGQRLLMYGIMAMLIAALIAAIASSLFS